MRTAIGSSIGALCSDLILHSLGVDIIWATLGLWLGMSILGYAIAISLPDKKDIQSIKRLNR